MLIKRVTVLLTVVLSLAAFGAAASESFNSYLMLSGLAGSSDAKGYQDWIECSSVEYSIEGLPGPMMLLSEKEGMGGALEGRDVAESYIDLTKEVDKHSPKLLDAHRSNRIFPGMKLALCSVAGEQFLSIEASGVVITGYDRVDRTETLRLNFEKIEFKFTPLK